MNAPLTDPRDIATASRAGRVCANCRWAERPEDETTCHRHAPVATGGMMSEPRTMWPVVGLNDWCGDFEQEEIDF